MATIDENGVVSLDPLDHIVLNVLETASDLPMSLDDVLSAAEAHSQMTPDLLPPGVLGPWTGPVLRKLADVGYVEFAGPFRVFPLRDSRHDKLTLVTQTRRDGHSVFQQLANEEHWFAPMDSAVSELFRVSRWGGLYSKYKYELTDMAYMPWLKQRMERYVRENFERLVSGVTVANGIPAWMGPGGEDFSLRRHSRVIDELCNACSRRNLELHGIRLDTQDASSDSQD